MPHRLRASSSTPAARVIRVLTVLLLAVAVIALHNLDVGHGAPSSPVGQEVMAGLGVRDVHAGHHPAGHAAESAGHAAGTTSAPPAHQHGQDDGTGGAHHGWVGMCLAVIGTGFVLLAGVLALRREPRLVLRDLTRLPRLLAPDAHWRGRPASLHTLCVLRC